MGFIPKRSLILLPGLPTALTHLGTTGSPDLGNRSPKTRRLVVVPPGGVPWEGLPWEGLPWEGLPWEVSPWELPYKQVLPWGSTNTRGGQRTGVVGG